METTTLIVSHATANNLKAVEETSKTFRMNPPTKSMNKIEL